jgi:hypothetical protein
MSLEKANTTLTSQRDSTAVALVSQKKNEALAGQMKS